MTLHERDNTFFPIEVLWTCHILFSVVPRLMKREITNRYGIIWPHAYTYMGQQQVWNFQTHCTDCCHTSSRVGDSSGRLSSSVQTITKGDGTLSTEIHKDLLGHRSFVSIHRYSRKKARLRDLDPILGYRGSVSFFLPPPNFTLPISPHLTYPFPSLVSASLTSTRLTGLLAKQILISLLSAPSPSLSARPVPVPSFNPVSHCLGRSPHQLLLPVSMIGKFQVSLWTLDPH